MEKDVSKYFKDAVEKLKEANEELYKPEEDVVSLLVCQKSQHAIENYLKGYLLRNGIDPSPFESIESMYQECLKLNKEFKKVDLTNFTCDYIDTDMAYCNDFKEVSHCYELADGLDTLLRKEKIIA
ncbi:MAG: HEPN domain-containing protein [Eudoraea sp.]|nr:HEPN domain-containing protein [Eudoraea sp.]